jgi:hypothetical protein
MKLTCDEARNWVPRALLGDLEPAEKQDFDGHLAECTACAEEQKVYADTLAQVQSVVEVPVPRHFFVYPKEGGSSVVNLLRALAPSWKLAAGFATLAVAVFVALGAARLQFRAEAGVYSFSFGRLLSAPGSASNPVTQIDAIRAEVRELETRFRAERVEWMQLLRREIAESHRHDRQRQQQWDAALSRLESRLNGRIETSAGIVTTGMQEAVGGALQTMQRQRRQDLELTRASLEQLATRGDLRERETEAILSVLLQAASLPPK